MLLPTDVAEMGIWNACRPIFIIMLFAHNLTAIDGTPIAAATIGVDSGVTWIVQHTHGRRSGQWPEHRLAVVQT